MKSSTQEMLNMAVKKINKFKVEFLLGMSIVIYAALFSYLSILRLLSFGSHYYDLGIMNQVVYNTSRGRFLELTNPHVLSNTSRLAIHFDPILAFFAPFYKLWNTPQVLLIGQSVAIALGALGLYLISKRYLNKWESLLVSLIYLAYPLLHYVNMFDFHGVALSITFLIYAFYFLTSDEESNLFWGWIFIILSWLTKENVFLVTMLLGIYIYFKTKRKKLGLYLSIISALLFILIIFFIIPYFADGNGHFASSYYTFSVGENIKRLFRLRSINYLNEILYPLLYFPLFTPLILLISLPQFLLNLLSSNPLMAEFYFHYTSLIIPFVFISFIYSLYKIKKVLPFKTNGLSILLLGIILLINLKASDKQVKKYFARRINWKKLRVIQELQEKYSNDNLTISSTPQIAPFFTTHRVFYNFLFDPAYKNVGIEKDDIISQLDKYKKANFVIIAKWEVKKGKLNRLAFDKLKKDESFRLIFSKADIEVYKKI